MPSECADPSTRMTERALGGPQQSRPRSLTLIVGFLLVLHCGGYLMMVASVATGSGGITITRMIIEPPLDQGGIAWPGWEEIGAMLRDELEPLDSLAARYWWAKLNLLGGALFGPLLIAGLIGVFIGRSWGPICIYSYLATWLADKVTYLMLLGVAGVPKFSLAVGMTVFGILVLRCRSWRAWINGNGG